MKSRLNRGERLTEEVRKELISWIRNFREKHIREPSLVEIAKEFGISRQSAKVYRINARIAILEEARSEL